MKRPNKTKSTLTGAAMLFVLVAALFTVAVNVYAIVEEKSGGNNAVIAGVMLAVIIVLAAACTAIDYARRRFTVDKPVKKILDATDKIAKGDFSVRLDITHSPSRYDEYDCIMENLNKMAGELSRTEVLHTDFISNVSHELKTPLAVIQNYATMLQNKNSDEDARKKYAQTLCEASKKLTALVTNILKLNKLENAEITEEHERVNLAQSLSESVVAYEELIESKGIELNCDFDDDATVYSSPQYLEIVWNNLLSNAIKFTESGGKIFVGLKRVGDSVEVKISDTGCGISAETGKHIFEKFYQGDTSHAGEGNGLGLALVKKVIDITGGTIGVESELGKGTTFTIKLKAE